MGIILSVYRKWLGASYKHLFTRYRTNVLTENPQFCTHQKFSVIAFVYIRTQIDIAIAMASMTACINMEFMKNFWSQQNWGFTLRYSWSAYWWGLCAWKKISSQSPFWAFLVHFSEFHFFQIFDFFRFFPFLEYLTMSKT